MSTIDESSPSEFTNIDKMLSQLHPDYGGLNALEKEAIKNFCVTWAVFDFHCSRFMDWTIGKTIGYNQIKQVANKAYLKIGSVDKSMEAFSYWKKRYSSLPSGADHLNQLFMKIDVDDEPEGGFQFVQSGFSSQPSDQERLKCCFIIVYRFRSNLFHGVKAGIGFDDQYDNFNHASQVMIEAIEALQQ